MPSSAKFSKQNKSIVLSSVGRKVVKKKMTESSAHGDESSISSLMEFSEECNVCHRTFKSKEHYSKHRRGALCRRLVQKIARKHRKLALKAKNYNSIQQNIHRIPKKKVSRNGQTHLVFKPYQCTICCARFYDKVNVELHLEREHATTQQLWTEVSPVKLDNGGRLIEPTNNIHYSSSSTYVNTNGSVDPICIDMNSSQYYNNNRQKCIECNLQFNSVNELSNHQRLNHNNSMELNSIQNSNLCHSRNINPYLPHPVPTNCHTNSSINQTIQNKDISLSNMNVSNEQAPSHSGYIYPQNYYTNNVSNVHIQQGLINPSNQYHNSNQTQHSNNLVHHHSTNIPQQQLIHQQPDQSLVHENGVPIQHYQQQFNHIASTSSVNQDTHGNQSQFILGMQINNEEPALTNNNAQPEITNATTSDGNVTIDSADDYNESTIEPKSGSLKSKTSKPNVIPPQSSTITNYKWNMCGECGLKFLDLMNLELHIERKHPDLKIFGSIVLGEGIVCYKTGVVSGKNDRNSLKDAKINQKHSCVLCNHKTKSLLTMVDHVTSIHFLSGRNMVNSILSTGETTDDHGDGKHKSKDSEQMTKSRRHGGKINNDKGNSIQDTTNQCHLCLQIFKTSAEVIRHSIKDKNHTCVICCFVTCSKHELFEHMKSEHQNWNDFNNFTVDDNNSVKKNVSCFQCKREFKKTSDLLNHLEIHGSLTGKCEKCGKQDYNIASVLIHMTTLHPHYMNKLKVTLMMKGKMVSGIYMQTISGDLLDWPQNSKKNDENKIIVVNNSSSGLIKKSNSVSKAAVMFACSQCYQCFSGLKYLQVHLKRHLDGGTSNNLSDSNGGFSCIKTLPTTKYFQCELCGYTNENSSEKVVNHIKNMHISGNLLHIVSGDFSKSSTITVVSPLALKNLSF